MPLHIPPTSLKCHDEVAFTSNVDDPCKSLDYFLRSNFVNVHGQSVFAVHDVGLVDNVADSGEDSEDEWNYYKGDSANKENIEPSKADIEVMVIYCVLDLLSIKL